MVPNYLSVVGLFCSLAGVNSLRWETSLSNNELLRLPGFAFPYTVILISPSSFMSAFTSVLIDRLLRLKTSFLYLENLSSALFTCTNYSRTHAVPGFLTDA